jgi:deoxyribose-phosphate aldolase
MDWTYDDIAKMIDHSLLHPALSTMELEEGCGLAVEYGVASVCILPYYLRTSVSLLVGSNVKPSTTVGFPHGGNSTKVKLIEAEKALEDGAKELDVVVNISKVLSGDWEFVESELSSLIELTHEREQLIKVIFENCYLDDDQKIRLCQICGELKADWVKTSTGYGTGGATIEDLTLMRKHSPPGVQVKAAGGVRNLEQLLAVRAIGVTRVGASSTRVILDECRSRLRL